MSKNLLIVSRTTVFHNKSGGMETQLSNLIKALSSEYSITVLSTALKIDQSINKTEIHDGITYIFLKNTIPGEYGINLYENLFWQIPVKRNFKYFGKNFRSVAAKYFESNLKNDFEFIVSQSSSANNFKLTKNQKLILIYHGTTLNELKSRINGAKSIKDFIRILFLDTPTLLFEYLFKNTVLFFKAKNIVLVSKLIESDFRHQYPLFKKKIVIIPNAIDTDFFKSNKEPKKNKVVYYGRIDFEKGLDDFIKVSEQLPGIDFEVYGEGTDKSQFIKLVSLKKIKNLKYFGAVDNSKIASVLSGSKYFLFLTKRKEGFPMSVLEALATENIIITTLELSKIDESIPYIHVSGAKEAVNILNSFIDNPQKILELRKKGRELATEKYSLNSFKKSFLGVLK